jgi:hypothetical protein
VVAMVLSCITPLNMVILRVWYHATTLHHSPLHRITFRERAAA